MCSPAPKGALAGLTATPVTVAAGEPMLGVSAVAVSDQGPSRPWLSVARTSTS